MGGCQNYDPFFGYPKYSVPYYNRTPKGTIILTTTHVRNCPVGRLPWHELDCQFDSCPRRQSTQVLRSPGRTSKKAHGELRAMLTIRGGRESKCEGSFSTATLATKLLLNYCSSLNYRSCHNYDYYHS